MKIAISNIAWDSADEPAVMALMTKYGLDGVEVAPTKVWKSPLAVTLEEAKATRRHWEAAGFRIAAMQSLLFGQPDLTVFGEASVRARTQAYLEKIITIAGWLGAGALVFGSPKNRLLGTRSPAEAAGIADTFFGALAESAQAAGTTFCLEPNPTAYGCDYARTVEEALEVIRRINHPGLRLNLDTGILAMNQEPIEESIAEALPWIGHVHLSEPQLGVVGSGAVDHERIASVLERSGYEGWVSVEMRSGWNNPNSVTVESALRAVSQCYASSTRTH